jgi:hypothetical protein
LIAEQDGRLGSYLESTESDSAFESLALLYVAMTRAKRGLYAIVEPVGKSNACSYPRLLAGSLGSEPREIEVGSARFTGAHVTGGSSWLTEGMRPHVPEMWKPEVVDSVRAVLRSPRRVASTQMERERTVAELLALDHDKRAAYGTEFHELISEVEWSDGLDVAKWAVASKKRGFTASVVDEAAKTLSAPSFAEVFKRPGDGWEVWRERGIEALIDGRWLSAVVDRVCISRGESGTVGAVRLYEFNTGKAPESGRLYNVTN